MPVCVCTGSDTLVISGRSSCPAAALDAPARVHTKRNSLLSVYRGRADSVGVMVAAHRQLPTYASALRFLDGPSAGQEAPRGPLRLAPWDHWHRTWLEETGHLRLMALCTHFAFTLSRHLSKALVCQGPGIDLGALRQEPSLCAHEPQLNKSRTRATRLKPEVFFEVHTSDSWVGKSARALSALGSLCRSALPPH
jgi:hypothetical protein